MLCWVLVAGAGAADAGDSNPGFPAGVLMRESIFAGGEPFVPLLQEHFTLFFFSLSFTLSLRYSPQLQT